MGLTTSQKAIWQKARSLGSGGQAVSLTDEMASSADENDADAMPDDADDEIPGA